MDKSVLISKLADVMEVSPADLTEDFAFNADNWDSLAHLGAISVIDEVCEITIPTNELKDCRNIGELLSLVDRSLSSN
jgi:acyl carrier protein